MTMDDAQLRRWLSLVIIFGATSELAAAQDPYQLLRQPGDGFAQVEPGRTFLFPQDHYPHERFKIEWWYLTANLTGSDGGLRYSLDAVSSGDELGHQSWWLAVESNLDGPCSDLHTA